MRKLLILLAAVCLSPCLARAQLGNVVLIHFSGAPTGGCSQNQLAENDTTGAVYNCASGSWAAITGSASSVAFSGVTTGTNASALHMGAGGSLDTAGGGTIAATSLEAKTWEAPGTIGSTTPNTGAFSTVSLTGQLTSTLATGTAPFSVTSTTPVANLSIGGNAATATSATSATNALGLTFGSTSIPLSATAPTANQCLAADGTAANIIGVTCGAGGGNVSTSGSPLNHQYAIFSPDSTHITGVTPGTAGLPLVSNGTSADPSAQALPVASLVAPSAAGDTVCGNSTPAWADCVPGVAGRTVTIATDTITAGDRLNSVLYNSASAVAVTLTSAASLGNNFAFKTCNENTGSATFIPGAGQINGGGSLVLAEGQCASISSPDNVNYIASISNGAISTDTSLSITRSPFGVQLGLSPTSFPFSGGPAGTSFQDVTETTNPGNPASGIDRVYFDSTTHLLTCHTSSGGNCAPSGGSTPTFDSGGTGLGQPAANAAWTMGANTISYTFGATTGTNNLINVTDTLNNTGTGYLLKAGTAGGSAASGLDLFATGSAAGAFTNAFALNVSNPTAATSSQAQPSPKMEMSGRTWSGVTPADTAESWSWQVVPAANTSNPAVNLTLVHESGTTGPLGIVLPASLTLTANTFTANSTTGGFTWNGPSSSLISLSSGGNANVTSTSSGSVNINGGQILISPSGTNSIKLLGSSTASDVVAVIHFGNASPTGDALDFQNSSNVVQASLGPNFTFTKYNSTALVGSGMDYDVFNTVHGNTNTSITSTTLATVGAADQNFTVTGGISQVDVGTTCTVAGSVQVNIIYTDALSGVAVTVSPDIDAGTTLPAITLPFSTSAVGAANVGTFRWMARAKASTTISYSTTYNNGTCGTQANMNIAPVLELR